MDNFPDVPFVFENGDPIIVSNQKKYIVTLTNNKLGIDSSGMFTRLCLPTEILEKYKFI